MSNKTFDEKLNEIIACDIDGEVEISRWQLHLINRIIKCESLRDAVTIVEVSKDLITEYSQSVLPTYMVRFDNLNSGACPYCDHDGIDDYYDKRCKGCNGLLEPNSHEAMVHHLMRYYPPFEEER